MSKPVILTGLRANNDLHLGNYFGALLPIVDMAKQKSDDYQINLFVPDLHSITTPVDYIKLQPQILSSLQVFAAAGFPLDNPEVNIYRQSRISAHSELAWILNCFTGMGELQRMTQFKDKSANLGEDRIGVGLFDYPVLMAADILLYDSKYVPVGDDQTQHLEFTRDIAQRLNSKFGNLFTVPEPVNKQHEFFGKDQGLRIKDLVEPTKKMSKSNESAKGVIFLNDDPEEAHKKIMSATTDSLGAVKYDPKHQPGISNLLEILGLLRDGNFKEVREEFVGVKEYGQFKKIVADEVREFLVNFQAKLAQVNGSEISQKLDSSEEAMNKQAQQKLAKVQKAVGLR